jgi:hypothetical protein
VTFSERNGNGDLTSLDSLSSCSSSSSGLSLDYGEQTSDMFSDAAKYSYTALCSLSLRDLYIQDLPHHTFSTSIIHNIRLHLGLPNHSDEVMLALFHGEGVQRAEVYVEIVKQEGHAFAFFIVKDLIYHSVRSGTNKNASKCEDILFMSSKETTSIQNMFSMKV